jgi:predicted phosphoribosyltransferase
MGTLRIVSNSSQAFSSRMEAGDLLARQLEQIENRKSKIENPLVVLGIPRGGVVVAREIAHALQADLDMVLAHKLGAPGNPELAIGAVCEDGKLFLDEQISSYMGADDNYIKREKARQLQEIARRVKHYRKVLPKISLTDRVVIVTDDGVATGATMQAALWAVRQEAPQKIVAALPVGPEETLQKLSQDADETICLQAPPFFSAISQFYSYFNQVEDEELLEILQEEYKRRSEPKS